MEDKYKIKDHGLLKKDTLFSKFGPVTICGILQHEYSRRCKERD